MRRVNALQNRFDHFLVGDLDSKMHMTGFINAHEDPPSSALLSTEPSQPPQINPGDSDSIPLTL